MLSGILYILLILLKFVMFFLFFLGSAIIIRLFQIEILLPWTRQIAIAQMIIVSVILMMSDRKRKKRFMQFLKQHPEAAWVIFKDFTLSELDYQKPDQNGTFSGCKGTKLPYTHGSFTPSSARHKSSCKVHYITEGEHLVSGKAIIEIDPKTLRPIESADYIEYRFQVSRGRFYQISYNQDTKSMEIKDSTA